MIASEELVRRYGSETAAIVVACRVFAGTASNAQLQQLLSSVTINWEVFYKQTSRHHVRPIVFKAMHSCNIPTGIKRRLHNDSKRIALDNLAHARELVRLHRLFREKRITAVPYKGSMLAQKYYQDLTLREASDIDFLIDSGIAPIVALKEAMTGAGYMDKSDVPESFLDTYLKYSREYAFDMVEGEERKFHAEFHWFAASQVFDFDRPMPNAVFFEQLTTTDLLNESINTLNDDGHLLAIILHHGLNQQWGQLKYVLDLVMLLKNSDSLHIDEIKLLAAKYGFVKALNIGLFLAREVLGIEPAGDFDNLADRQFYMDHLFADDKKRKTQVEKFAAGSKIKDSASARRRLLLNYILYSVAPSIRDYRFLKLPRPLYPLYAIVKPIRLLLGVFRW